MWDGYALGEPARLYEVAFEVSYRPDPQGTARRVDGWEGRLHLLVGGLGVLLVPLGLALR